MNNENVVLSRDDFNELMMYVHYANYHLKPGASDDLLEHMHDNNTAMYKILEAAQ